jgi:hypothetical protein
MIRKETMPSGLPIFSSADLITGAIFNDKIVSSSQILDGKSVYHDPHRHKKYQSVCLSFTDGTEMIGILILEA